MKASSSKKSGFLSTAREILVLLFIVFIIRTFGFGLYQVPTGSMETTMLVGERFFADKFTPLFSSIKHKDIIAFNDPTFDYSSNSLIRLFQDYVWGPSNWTKRVIGIPGDKIKGVLEEGKPVIYLNDKKLNEPYLNKYPLIEVWNNIGSGDSRVFKSWDTAFSFNKQPFYRIKSELVRKDRQGDYILRKPGTPSVDPELVRGYVKRRGKSYWGGGSDEFYVELGPDEYWVMGDNRLGSHDSRFLGPIKKRLIHGRILFRIWSVDSYENWWFIDLFKHPIDFFKRVRWNRFFQRVK